LPPARALREKVVKIIENGCHRRNPDLSGLRPTSRTIATFSFPDPHLLGMM